MDARAHAQADAAVHAQEDVPAPAPEAALPPAPPAVRENARMRPAADVTNVPRRAMRVVPQVVPTHARDNATVPAMTIV